MTLSRALDNSVEFSGEFCPAWRIQIGFVQEVTTNVAGFLIRPAFSTLLFCFLLVDTFAISSNQ
jgi:hypothetical protein